jgi:MFS family permease
MADTHNRLWLIFIGVAIWSVATAACGLAQQFWQLLLARVGVGAGEAALGPCASSLLSDLFPRDRLTFAFTVYNLGSVVGAGMAFIIGGQIVEMVARSPHFALPMIGEVRSWQAVFFFVGIPGALLSFIVFTFPEPIRRGIRNASMVKRASPATYLELFKFMRTHGRFFLFHYLGFGLGMAVLVGGGAWYAPHLARTFHWGPADIGLGVGLAMALGSISGQLIGGRIVDALFRRGHRDAQMRWYMLALVAATPIGIVAMTASNVWVFLILLYFLLVAMSSLPSMAMAALNIVTPNELRGTGIAFFALLTGTLGAGTGPVLIAAVSDYVFRDENAIGRATAVVIAVCLPLAALCLGLGLGAMRRAVQAADQWANTTEAPIG